MDVMSQLARHGDPAKASQNSFPGLIRATHRPIFLVPPVY
jgi:hypothetical protein